MKTFYLLTIAILTCFTIHSQNTISGKILNTTNQPIDFAEVQLIQIDGHNQKQAFSSELGVFEVTDVPSAEYTMKIIYLGSELYNQKIKVAGNLKLQTITIEENQQLEEIVVNAERKLVERKVDRLVFNTANSIASQGMDGMEALSNTPLVKVVDNKISIAGKSNVTVMIDERILYMSGDELANYLKTLRSDDIERIEVITSPPAKYEASGNSGLINIVMKKNKRMGMYGTVGGSYVYNNNSAYTGNGSVNYQNKKWNIMLKANASDGGFQNNNKLAYVSPTEGYNSETKYTGDYNNVGVNLTTNYQLTDNALIGASYSTSKSNSDYNSKTRTNYITYPTAVIDSTINSLTDQTNIYRYNTFNTFFEQKLDTVGSKLALGVNYFGNTPDNNTSVYDNNTLNTQKNHLYYNSNLKYNVWSANADLNYTLSWAEIEVGAKYTNYSNKSIANYYNVVNDNYIYDDLKSNQFDYSEDSYAAYFSISKKITDKLQAKAGLRYEQVEIEGKLIGSSKDDFNKSYGKLFPSAYISYELNDSNSFSFNYTKRINRPFSSILNPFREYSNTYTYFSGNPDLNPSFANNYELSYVYDSNLSISLGYSKLIDSFDQFTVYKDGIISYSYYNMLNKETYSLNASYSNKIFSWWETNTGADSYYTSSYYTKNTTQIPQNGITFSYYSYNTFNLNTAKTIKASVNWYHQLPNKEDNTRYKDFKYLSTGLKFALLDSKLNINAVLHDVFNTSRSKGISYNSTNTQTYLYKWNSRGINISASYTFGNSKNKKEIKEATFEDIERSK